MQSGFNRIFHEKESAMLSISQSDEEKGDGVSSLHVKRIPLSVILCLFVSVYICGRYHQCLSLAPSYIESCQFCLLATVVGEGSATYAIKNYLSFNLAHQQYYQQQQRTVMAQLRFLCFHRSAVIRFF